MHKRSAVGISLLLCTCVQVCKAGELEESCNAGLFPQQLHTHSQMSVGVSFAQRQTMLAKTSYLNWDMDFSIEGPQVQNLIRPIVQFIVVPHSGPSTTARPTAFKSGTATNLPAAEGSNSSVTLDPTSAVTLDPTPTLDPTSARGGATLGPTVAPVDLEHMGMKVDSPHDLAVVVHSLVVAVVVAVLCLFSFDVLRRQLPEVYAARCVGQPSNRGLLTPSLPSLSWGSALAAGWKMQEEELLASSGLDGFIFLKFWDCCLQALIVSTAIICPILFISHMRGDTYHSTLLLQLCILNVPNGSVLLWLDAVAVWLIAVIVFYFLFLAHEDLARRRLVYLRDRPHANQVFVYSIPAGATTFLSFGADSAGGQGSCRILENFFQRCHPDSVTATEPIGVAGDHDDSSCGIVTFRTVRDAHICAQTQHGSTRHRWQVRLAPDNEEELLKENMTQTNAWSLSRTAIGIAGLVGVFFFWFVPVSAVCALARLQTLYQVLPASVHWFRRHPLITPMVEGILATAGLNMFMMLLPYILTFLSRLRGHLLERDVDRSVQNMLFCFQLIFVLLVAALGQSALIVLVEFARSPERVVGAVGLVLPRVSNFYISYLILQLAILSFRLLYIYSLYVRSVSKKSQSTTEQLRMPLESWGVKYARWTIILVIALVYSTITPIVLPLAVCVFALGYAVHSYEIVYVTEAPFDIGGLHLPLATSHVQVGLAVHQFVMTALLIVHGSRSWMLVAPLPFVNYAFFDYLRATFKVRFLPLEDLQTHPSKETI